MGVTASTGYRVRKRAYIKARHIFLLDESAQFGKHHQFGTRGNSLGDNGSHGGGLRSSGDCDLR